MEAQHSGEVASASGYIPGLDGLRAFAVAAVFLLHLDQRHFRGGAVGVDVFFVISAYLITGLLLVRIDEPNRFRRFYWRRVFRLYPALIVFTFLIGTPAAIASGEGDKAPIAIVGTLLYINDFLMAFTHRIPAAFDQTWSLAVEEQFYLVWAPLALLVIVRLRRRAQYAALGAITAAGALLIIQGANYFLPTGHLFGLALGSLVAWAMHQGWRPRIPTVAVWAAAALLGLAVIWNPPGTTVFRLWLLARFIAATVLVISLDTNRNSILSRLLSLKPVLWVGVRSYGVYLYGLSLMILIPALTGLPLRYAAPLDILVTALVVAASYRWIEAPARRAGRRWLLR